jgi:hypothetical protein
MIRNTQIGLSEHLTEIPMPFLQTGFCQILPYKVYAHLISRANFYWGQTHPFGTLIIIFPITNTCAETKRCVMDQLSGK